MISIRVCSAATVDHHRSFKPHYVVSIHGKSVPAAPPAWMPEENWFEFAFDDVTSAGSEGAPTNADIRNLISLAATLAWPDSKARILFHCAAGVSRSTAAAYIFLCVHLGPGHEKEAITQTVENSESQWIWPNSLMVRYADDLLGRDGAMIDTLDDWERSMLHM